MRHIICAAAFFHRVLLFSILIKLFSAKALSIAAMLASRLGSECSGISGIAASSLKDEFKARGLALASGDAAVTATEQIAGRLDTKSVKQFLGDAYVKFETAVVIHRGSANFPSDSSVSRDRRERRRK